MRFVVLGAFVLAGTLGAVDTAAADDGDSRGPLILREQGNFFVGGTPWQANFDGIVWADLRTGEIWEVQTESGHADPSRGGVDPEGNGWNGGRGGRITEFERKTHQVREWESPTPFVTFYEAKPDKNGEIWAGAQRGGRMVRFNPKTDRWIEYIFPEPFSLDWRTWIAM